MEEFLEQLILTGLKGRIYDLIVLRKANQKMKLRDAKQIQSKISIRDR